MKQYNLFHETEHVLWFLEKPSKFINIRISLYSSFRFYQSPSHLFRTACIFSDTNVMKTSNEKIELRLISQIFNYIQLPHVSFLFHLLSIIDNYLWHHIGIKCSTEESKRSRVF